MSNRFDNTFSYKLIYVFRINDEAHKGLLKIGEATVHNVIDMSLLGDNSSTLNSSAKTRIDSYTKTAAIKYELLWTSLAVTNKGKGFRDYNVHEVLRRSGKSKKVFDKENNANEWFEVDLETAKAAINAVKEHKGSLMSHEITIDQSPVVFRPEQEEAIKKTVKQFTSKGMLKSGQARMLWNAKMRFGKTLTALQVAKQLNFPRTIIATHRPVVKEGWFEDFNKIFYDRPDFKYGSTTHGESLQKLVGYANEGGHFIYFASIQYLRGSKLVGGHHAKNEELFATEWDYLIIDEAHEGTQTKLGEDVIKNLTKTNTKMLYLSGTPFNLIKGYKEEEIFTWDYIMEQKAKLTWYERHLGDSNPYEILPRLNIFTYDIGKEIPNFEDIEDCAFNFKEFFRTWTGDIEADRKPMPSDTKVGEFVYKDDVRSFLNLMIKSGTHNYPFANEEYRDNFRHTLWVVPGVKEAKALSALLKEHTVFGSCGFEIVNVAGDGDEEEKSEEALKKLRKAITDKPEQTRTITLSCGRLTTGVTVPEWTAVFMLAGSYSTSASSYLQTIFRVQSPAYIDGKMKTDCFVFDFAPDRTLKMVAEAGQLSLRSSDIDSKKLMGEFLNFCPVIGVEGSSMKNYDVGTMLAHLKRAMIDKVARNGFDDKNLYNDKLLKLSALEVQRFQDLKKILGASKANRNANDIPINEQGLDGEVHEYVETDLEKKPKKELTPEERRRLEELKEQRKQISAAISILRGISIRIPLLVYGAELTDEKKGISVANFTGIIDDRSWEEFMPKGVTKEKFKEFSGYFDNEVFIEAGKRIRLQARAADKLSITERVNALADIFATFRNPDKETVLTPWRVVNMHLGDCIGGSNFFEPGYEKRIEIEDGKQPRVINVIGVTENIFVPSTKVLDINSKTGLYPLYIAYSIYEVLKTKYGKTKRPDDLWQEILRNNIFAVCKTRMAAAITCRTLRGFNSYSTNILAYEDIVADMKSDAELRKKNPEQAIKVVSKISNPKKWNITGGNEMKFNAIVGNPPYQENISGTEANNSLGKQLFPYFIMSAIQQGADFVSLITPSRWFAGDAQDGSFIKLREFVKDNNHFSRVHNYPNATEVFNNVVIKGGVSYWLFDRRHAGRLDFNTNVDGKTLTENRNLFEDDLNIVISNATSYGILKKVKANNFVSMYTITKGRNAFGITGKKDIVEKISKKEKYPGAVALQCMAEEIRWTDEANITKSLDVFNAYKVFISKSAGDPSTDKKVIGKAYPVQPKWACTDSLIPIGCFDSQEEAENLSKYLKTRFLRFLVSVMKVSQNVYQNVYQFVPLQDFTGNSNIDWSKSVSDIDKQLYKIYNLSDEQIAYIEKTIAPM